MSTVTTVKRSLETVGDFSAESLKDVSDVKNESGNKKKVGRKPLEGNDTKSKRTAQNRAAQRAFRERKEKKMQQLEDKVKSLEKFKMQNEVESEFLRGQLSLMVRELKGYRPESNSDLKVLDYLARYEETNKTGDSNTSAQNNEMTTHINELIDKKKDFTFEYSAKQDKNGRMLSPGSSNSSPNDFINMRMKQTSIQTNNKISTPGSSTSSFSSWMDPVFYNDDAQNLPHFDSSSRARSTIISKTDNSSSRTVGEKFKIKQEKQFDSVQLPLGYDSDLFSNDFNFNGQFDEQVSTFCVKMNQVCGTKENPVPKSMISRNPNDEEDGSDAFASSEKTDLTPNEVDRNKLDFNLFGKPSPNELTHSWDSTTINNSDLSSNSDFGKLGFGTPDGIPSWNDYIYLQNDSRASLPPSSVDTDKHSENIASPVLDVDIKSKSNIPFLDPSFAFPDVSTELINNEGFFRDSNIDYQNDLFDDLLGTEENELEEDLISKKLVNEELCARAKYKHGDMIVKTTEGNLLKCSEVWDRITSHPRYSDIDIDGLCQELMYNAKCSEKGVVVDSNDVNEALSKHMTSSNGI